MAKVYIAGKISGDPLAKVKFEETACRYRKDGDIVLNPAELPEGMERADYMEICFAMINAADVVVFRPGYEYSEGARLELAYCRYIGKRHMVPKNDEELDIVAVVRCKNCQYAEVGLMEGIWCNHPDNRNPLGCHPADYCNAGLRRDAK